MTSIASTVSAFRRAIAARRPHPPAGALRACAVFAVAVSVPGCAARMSVGSHVAAGLDVGQYRTFDWGPADSLPAGDPRLEQNPLFQDHVLGSVERRLAGRGLTRAAINDQPDLLVHYHAVVSRRLDVNRIDDDYGYCFDDDCRVRVVEYEQGTLVLDVVDAHTNKVIWRGWAQEAVDSLLKDDDRMARQIDEAVERMLSRFPLPQRGARR
jgi:hypothetical protein